MQELLTLISNLFKFVFNSLDHFYLVGKFSFLDALLAFIIVDIIITALFVTFNVHVGGGQDQVSARVDSPSVRSEKEYSQREAERLRYW